MSDQSGKGGCEHAWRKTAPDARYPGDWYYRCAKCGLDQTTDDGQGVLAKPTIEELRERMRKQRSPQVQALMDQLHWGILTGEKS